VTRPLFLATAIAPSGIHVSAELRINAMHLRDHNMAWAAECMERAARHIDALENERVQTAEAVGEKLAWE
jgi:hypothetical protein